MAKFSPCSLALWMALATASTASAESSSSSNDEEDNPYNADIDIQFNGCDYELTFSFEHDEELPLGTPVLCNKTEEIAEDGLPYFASRKKEYKFSDEIYEATGLASHGIDFNPCGHPPVDRFGGPHYDSHFYTTTERESWTCDLYHPEPICDYRPSAQTTASGLAVFNVATVIGSTNTTYSNMPAGFSCPVEHALPQMGEHCWNFDTMPNSFAEWDKPTHIMGSYNAGIAFWETMYSVNYVTGDDDHSHKETIDYEGQTIRTLPSEYELNYVAATGRSNIILRGTRATCDSDIFT